MSEQTNELTDADVGLPGIEKAQGYSPLPPDSAPELKDFPAEETETFGPKEAAAEVIKKRRDGADEGTPEGSAEGEPVHRDYIHLNGAKAGEPRPPNETVPISRAAADLEGLRSVEETIRLQQLESELLSQLDAKAAEEVQSQPPQYEANPVEPEPVRPEGQAGEQSDKMVRLFQENPELLQTLEAYNQQTEAKVAEAQQQTVQVAQAAQQQYVADLQANAGAATASIFVAFPELQGLQTQDQLRGAMSAIEQQNPQRAAQLRQHISNVQQLSAKAQEVQAQQAQWQQQQHRAQFDYVATQADNAYDKWITQQEPDAGRRQEIKTTAHQMLRDAGLSEQELGYHWQTSPILRSFTGQQILADAARYRMSVSGARSKAVRAVPTVQRPGSPLSHEPQERYDMRQLESRLNQSGSARDAAALLSARRGARR